MKFIFLTGPHASGKTYTTKKAISDNNINNVSIIDTGPIMRQIHKEKSPNTSMGEWVNLLQQQYGQDITSELISSEIEKRITNDNNDVVIVIGFRTLRGILYTVERLGIEDYKILYVDASFDLLYKNFVARTNKQISKEEFYEYLMDEQRSGLSSIRAMAVMGNEGIDYYYRESNEDDLDKYIISYINKAKVKELK